MPGSPQGNLPRYWRTANPVAPCPCRLSAPVVGFSYAREISAHREGVRVCRPLKRRLCLWST
jgi:hypothetical protein